MTEKLYYQDSFLREFDARVTACTPCADGRWAVELDATAFFPEGGGQAADPGTLGGAQVLDVQETGGAILHTLDAPLPVGETVHGTLDWSTRLRRMQDHTGEHIFSGLVHRHYGYANTGFHLGDGGMTVDYGGELSAAQITQLEEEANLAVFENDPLRPRFPRRRSWRSWNTAASWR